MPVPSPSPNQLSQNLWGEASAAGIFKLLGCCAPRLVRSLDVDFNKHVLQLVGILSPVAGV